MSLLEHFIKTYTILFLISYLTIFTNEVHAQAAPDFFWMDDITTVKPLETNTGAFQEQEQEQHHLGPNQPVKIPDDFEGKKETTTIKAYTSKASGCSFPPRLDYAEPREPYLFQTTFIKGSNVYYNCRPGYIRVPGVRMYATCLKDGTWSTLGIFCKRRSCGNPREVENAEMTADDFSFGSKVTYVCNPGYMMTTRRNYRECLADGTWSNTLPECEVQLCPPPPDIINGVVYPLKDEYSYLDSVTYSCNRNLALIGESSISCREDGQWSSNAPDCKVVNCLNPHVPNAIKISGTSGPYNLNSVVRFMCPIGTYVLNGSDTIKCNQNSEWEPAPPRCLGVCRYVPEIYFAEPVEPTRDHFFVQGTTLQFKCKEGYKPVPDVNNVLTCSGRTWTSYKTFCTRECGLPERILYAEPKPGALDNNTFPPNATVSYDCRPGYIRAPGTKNVITCLEDGTWSTPEVFCQRRSCRNPGELLNGNIEVTDLFFGSTATYTCNEGYRLSNKRNVSVCLADGTWSNVLPQCDAVLCAPPQSTANGEFIPPKEEYEYLDSVTFSCQKPLEVVGNASLSCTGTGEWSSNSPTCKAVNCANPDVKNSRRLSGFIGPYTLNSAISFACNKGFFLRGSSSISCNIDSQWVPAIPQCEIVNCSNPDVKNSSRLSGLTGPYTLDSVISFECDDGFVLKGSSSISCNSNGQWVPAIPQCKTVECSSPDVANAARLSGFSGSYHLNFTVTFECLPGFTMSGSNSVKCNSSSQWDPPLPTCNSLLENNVAEVMGNGILMLTMILVAHVISPHF